MSKEDDDELIEEHAQMVRAAALGIRAELGLHCDVRDLIAYGYAGLLEARARYDVAKGVPFRFFAHHRVRGAIYDGIREMSDVPRRAYERCRRAAIAEEVAERVAEPSDEPEYLDRENLGESLEALLGTVTATYVAIAAGDAEARGATPEDAVISEFERRKIRKLVDALPEVERTVVRGFYFEGRGFGQIGEAEGKSKDQIWRVHMRGLDMVREGLG